ncbi:sex-specific storage-protein 2-like [Belonocnema kinseyi]|uniref:sex-specific storage-protein 2-like n=1 Tax=Belonocnema kinseyi TaxID=2817044 RepID=UPI00143D96DB|nr:sex-specific storage-protein 2-like [Belonocnema kinseyi]
MLIMMLIKVCLVLALSILCSIQGNTHKRILDKDSIQKQLKIYELFLYISQDSLIDAAYYEVGKNYDITKNMKNYDNGSFLQHQIEKEAQKYRL